MNTQFNRLMSEDVLTAELRSDDTFEKKHAKKQKKAYVNRQERVAEQVFLNMLQHTQERGVLGLTMVHFYEMAC